MQISRHDLGFSLIELLIAMAVSGILAVIAYPSYASYQSRSVRQHAEAVLMLLAAQLAQYDEASGSYRGFDLKVSNLHQIPTNFPYKFTLVQITDDHFKLQATPSTSQSRRDPCGALQITDRNQRLVLGNASPQTCWSY